MHYKIQMIWAVSLLAVVLCGSVSAELLSSQNLADLKNRKVIVYMSEEQAGVSRIIGTPSSKAAPITSSTDSEGFASLIYKGVRPEDYRKDAGLPPEGTFIRPSGFKPLNQSMADGVFFNSITQITAKPFADKTWFNIIEISRETMDVSKGQLRNLLKWRYKQKEPMPDSAMVVSNLFVFGEDYYKLWFITQIEIYDVMAMGAVTQPSVALGKAHLEKFASLYDIRDHFESAASASSKDDDCCPEEVMDLWRKDGGKLYFDTVSQLASENAGLIKRFLLDQPPSNNPGEIQNKTIMALYPIEAKAEPQEDEKKYHGTPEEQQQAADNEAKKREFRKQDEKKHDASETGKMNALQRKAYMLGKEYGYVCLVDVVETAGDRVIARDLDRDVYYSLPNKNLKLIKQSDVDPDEYADLVVEYQKMKAEAESRWKAKHKKTVFTKKPTTNPDSQPVPESEPESE